MHAMRARGRTVVASVWFAPVVIFIVCWTMTTHGKYSVSGDEPHYLMVCRSLWADGDLDLRNNYQNDDGRHFGAAGLEKGLHARQNRQGALFPVHDIGVPIVLTPVYIVATTIARIPPEATLARFRMNRGLFAYSIISLSIIALVAAAAAVTRAALVLLGVQPALASVLVTIVWLSPPVLSNSFLVFPEPFALMATALALHAAFAAAPVRAQSNDTTSEPLLRLAAVLGCLPCLIASTPSTQRLCCSPCSGSRGQMLLL
jgi:hypothetical protein